MDIEKHGFYQIQNPFTKEANSIEEKMNISDLNKKMKELQIEEPSIKFKKRWSKKENLKDEVKVLKGLRNLTIDEEEL